MNLISPSVIFAFLAAGSSVSDAEERMCYVFSIEIKLVKNN